MDGMNNNDAMNPSVSNRKTQTFNGHRSHVSFS